MSNLVLASSQKLESQVNLRDLGLNLNAFILSLAKIKDFSRESLVQAQFKFKVMSGSCAYYKVL